MNNKKISKEIERIFEKSYPGRHISIYSLPWDNVEKIIKRAKLSITIDDVLYGRIFEMNFFKIDAYLVNGKKLVPVKKVRLLRQ